MRTIFLSLTGALMIAFAIGGILDQVGLVWHPPRLEAGALYAINDGEGQFRIAKLLALDEGGVHVRVYRELFDAPPAAVNPDQLTLGAVDDPDGSGMGHLPLTREMFLGWDPEFLSSGAVDSEELAAYAIWKAGGGGYLDNEAGEETDTE